MSLVGGLDEHTFEHSTFMVYARDAKGTLQPNETQRNTLIAAGVYILVIGILWYVLPCPLTDIFIPCIGMCLISTESVSTLILSR